MIKVENISFEYKSNAESRSGLRNVSVEIQKGENIAIMGHNGSGKTSFAQCLNGLLIPTRGHVVVDDYPSHDLEHLLNIRRRVGMVFQNPDNQIVSATVEREIAFGLENIGLPYETMHKIVDEMLESFHLLPYRYHSPHYLSGGEKQRLAIAAVMAMQPNYLILDEPTSLLDPKSRRDILNIVNALHKDNPSISTLLITQYPEEALTADRLLVFYRGQLVLDDSPSHVFEQDALLEKYELTAPVSYLLKKYLPG